MDQETLTNLILRGANQDKLNGVGRVFKNEFLAKYSVNEAEFFAALKFMEKRWRGVSFRDYDGNVILLELGGCVCVNKQTNCKIN